MGIWPGVGGGGGGGVCAGPYKYPQTAEDAAIQWQDCNWNNTFDTVTVTAYYPQYINASVQTWYFIFTIF